MPLISIITVCKNPGQLLARSIGSLHEQTFNDYELIVVDGASTDGTAQFLESNRAIVSKYVSEPDDGIYDAMNKGVEMATGDYVYFLNCGDEFFDRYVLETISGYCFSSTPDLLYGDSMLIDEEKRSHRIKKHDHVDKFYLFHRPINHQAIFARRLLFRKIGGFNTRYVVKADHDWIVRALRQGAKFQYVPVIISRYLLHGFAFKNRSKYRAKEKRAIQRAHFSFPGRIVVRALHRLGIQPTGIVRNIVNLAL